MMVKRPSLSEGQLTLILNKNSPLIGLRTKSKKVLNRIFAEGKHPCRSMYWILKNDLDVTRICSRIEEGCGKRPFSSSYIGSGENRILTHAYYRILPYSNEIQIRIERPNRDGRDARVGIFHEGTIDKGFFKLIMFSAHTLNYWIFFMIR